MDDLLNPMAPRNPIQQAQQGTPEDETPQKYIEGAESLPLPSRGVFYSWDPKFWNMETLYVRQLNYTDEDILTTKQYFENGTVFNELLKNCIVDENKFPATGLVPVDRDTILLWLRTTSFGKDFEISFQCPKCGEMIAVSWDISTFDIPKYPDEIYEELKTTGEYRIVTPLKDLAVRIVVPTIGKSLETEKRLTAKKVAKKTTQDFYGTGSLMLLMSGIEVDGRVIRDKALIEAHLAKINFPISDARFVRKQVDKINLKYNTAKDVQCSNQNCDHIEEGVEMPIIHPNFFWPDYSV
jgi:hypothetical protein